MPTGLRFVETGLDIDIAFRGNMPRHFFWRGIRAIHDIGASFVLDAEVSASGLILPKRSFQDRRSRNAWAFFLPHGINRPNGTAPRVEKPRLWDDSGKAPAGGRRYRRNVHRFCRARRSERNVRRVQGFLDPGIEADGIAGGLRDPTISRAPARPPAATSSTSPHGTTVGTNAMYSKRTARKTGLLVTAGFRRIYEIGEQSRPLRRDDLRPVLP